MMLCNAPEFISETFRVLGFETFGFWHIAILGIVLGKIL